MVSSKVDGRACRLNVAHKDDKMGAQQKTAPAGALTPGEGLTEPLGGSALSNATKRDKADIAGEFLDLSRKNFEKAARLRLYYILLSRKHGVSNAKIGAHLGITESAVRAMVKRHGNDDPSSVLIGDA